MRFIVSFAGLFAVLGAGPPGSPVGTTIPRVAKGLVCAGGEATRLGELTRVANKHLLPVGSWPMIYYPLQLLQLAGIREVLVVTGKGHAGQMIDLLGDGRLTARGTDDRCWTSISPTRCRPRPAGSRRSSGWRGSFAGGDRSWSCSATTSSSTRTRTRSARWAADGAGRAHLRQGGARSRELRRRRLRRGRPRHATSSRRPASSTALRRAADLARGRGPLLLPRGRLRRDPRPRAVEPRRARDHGREPPLRAARRPRRRPGRGWWEDAGKHWQHLAEIGRTIEATGANK